MAKSILDRIKQTRINMLLDLPFFGALALRLELKEDASIPSTLATDGTHLFYNPTFDWQGLGKLDKWSDAQLLTGIVHEIAHCVLKHPFRAGSRTALVHTPMGVMPLWTLAIEHPTNDLVQNAGHTLPKAAVFDKKYQGWCAERVYDDLLDQAKQNGPPKGCGCSQGQQSQGDGQGHAGHLPEGTGGQCVKPAPTGKDGGVKGATEQEWNQAIRQAAQVAKQRGLLSNGLEALIEDIVEPKLDWRSLLREFVQTSMDRTDYQWTRPNRAYSYYDVVLPGLHGESAPAFAVAIDTSGSVSDAELALFSAEIASIAEDVKPFELYIIHCDAAVHKVETFYRGDEVRITKFAGRGGTSFKPPFERVQADRLDIAALIYLTDLEGDFPDAPEYPTLWVSTGDKKAVAPFGQTVRLEVDNG